MYYYIKGNLNLLLNDYAVIDNNGIGYKLSITSNTFSKIASSLGKEVQLYTYFNVKEDSQELFGFYNIDEHASFSKLITVSGIGPKAALSILSTLTVEQLMLCVQNGDAKTISRANGVGLKTAQKVIIELKGKLDLNSSSENAATSTVMNDVAESLVVLGFTTAEALNALKGIDLTLPIEEIITLALKKFNKS
ncbi:Holliday junction branch migration protein RuvA [Eubacteriales bacterium OttesenSCG-928-G02]|nr:Holliday junction branch migration protein RuvA [Eubacteriales bacterium OttesenSCG-928-G02]